MVKMVVLLVRKASLSHEEFARYWEEEHAPLVEELPNVRRYTTSLPTDPEESPYDGIAELYFESTDDIREGFTDDLEADISADEEGFLASVDTFVAAEQTQLDRR